MTEAAAAFWAGLALGGLIAVVALTEMVDGFDKEESDGQGQNQR